MRPINHHAVVLGASMAGLTAARVLADAYERVTVLDRDTLPPVGYLQAGVRWYNDGLLLRQAPSGLTALMASRPLLESRVRDRLRALGNVRVVDGCAATGLAATPDGRGVGGVRVIGRGGGELVRADLVVDATGRGSRGPAWLEELGYQRPVEEQVRGGRPGRRATRGCAGHPLSGQRASPLRAPRPVPGRVPGRRGRGVRLQPDLRPGHDGGRARGPDPARLPAPGPDRPRLPLPEADRRDRGHPVGDRRRFRPALPGGGGATAKVRLVNAYLARLHVAAATDPEVGRAFLRVVNLIDPPQRLLRPATALRVLRGQRRLRHSAVRSRRAVDQLAGSCRRPSSVRAGPPCDAQVASGTGSCR